jgi:hypothetical protein
MALARRKWIASPAEIISVLLSLWQKGADGGLPMVKTVLASMDELRILKELWKNIVRHLVDLYFFFFSFHARN